LQTTGTYTVRFTPAGPATGDLSIQVEAPITGPLTAGGAAFVSNLTSEPGDATVLTFTGTAGQSIDLVTQLQDPSFTNFGANGIEIIEPDGQTQLYSVSGFNGNHNISGPLTLPVTGNYTVQFNPAGPATGAMSIQLDTPIAGTLSAGGPAFTSNLTSEPGDATVLTFSGTAGQSVDLVTQLQDPSFENFGANSVEIIEPDGQTLLYSTPGGFGGNHKLSGPLSLPTTGTYTVQFNPAGPATGIMSIQLDTPITGTLTAGGSAVTSNLTSEPGDAVVLTFAGTAGQAVDLVTLLQDPSMTNFGANSVEIIEPDGQTQLYSAGFGGVSNLSGTLILPVTGTYTVQFTPAGPSTGDMSIQLDTPVSGMLTLGGPSVTVSDAATPGDVMTLNFAGTAGQAVRLVTLPDSTFSGTNVVTIIEPDGQTKLYSAAFGASNLSGVLTLPATGTYTVTFMPTQAGNGNVTMSLDQPIATTIIAGGPPVASNVASPGDVVALSFSGTAGQSVELITQLASAFTGTTNTISITEPDGRTQLFSTGFSSSFNVSGVLTLPTTGTYVAQLTPSSPATGDVTMQLDLPVTGTLSIGGPTVAESVTAPGGPVMLSFSGTANQPVELLTQLSSSFASATNYVTIFEPNGTTELYLSGFGGTSNLTGVLTLPTTGTYTAELTQTGLNTGSVSMTLYDAGASAMGAMDFTATIASPGSTAQLAFNGTANSRVSLLTVADSNLDQGCFTISITEPGSTTALYSSTQSSSTDFSHALTLPVSGLYTMLLTPCGSATGTAALTLYSVPPDAIGSTTIGGTAASLTTTAPGQNVQVTFPTSASGQTANIAVTADSSFSSACYTVTVLGLSPDGTTLSYGGSGSLVGIDGNWSFGTQTDGAGDHALLLNGTQANGGFGIELVMSQGGHAFTLNAQGTWFEWINGRWAGASNPLGGGSGTPAGPPTSTGQGCGTSYSTGVLTMGPAGTNTVTISSVSAATGNVTVGVTAQ